MTTIQLRILYCSVSGTAKQVAETIALACDQWPDGAVEVCDMAQADASCLDPSGPVVVLCVATAGSGDIPVDGLNLYSQLQNEPRYLGGLRYGLVALGDSSYGDTFCGGGLRFDSALLDLGAKRVGEILKLDATDESLPEAIATEWFREWRSTNGLSES